MIEDLHQDLKKETIVEVRTVKNEMIADLHQDLKKETIVEVLSATKEVIADLHQDLKKETIVKVRTEKKVVNLLSLKRNLEVLKKDPLKNFLRNLQFNSNNFSSVDLNQQNWQILSNLNFTNPCPH